MNDADWEKLSDWEKLMALLKEAGAKVTFSINCRSGLLGRDKCNCWRCRKERGEPVTEETEKLAAEEAKEADRVHRERQRQWFEKNKHLFKHE